MSDFYFDSKGQLNAADFKDAVSKLAKIASVMDSMPSAVEIPSLSTE
jgi:hypothetical protein